MDVKERPILMHAWSIRQIRHGKKTQTRRIIKIDPSAKYIQQCCDCTAEFALPDREVKVKQRYGVRGDRLWVREAWRQAILTGPEYRADYADHYQAGRKWRPSLLMPRVVSRIILEVTSVRVQCVQDISYADIIAEGLHEFLTDEQQTDAARKREAREAFSRLWNETNGKGAWDRNDWVWRIEFRRIA